MQPEERLERIERLLGELVSARRQGLLHRRAVRRAGRARPFTVRQWCNLGRIHAERSMTRSGACQMWAISQEEYLRFQRFGLLPVRRPA